MERLEDSTNGGPESRVRHQNVQWVDVEHDTGMREPPDTVIEGKCEQGSDLVARGGMG